MAAGWLSACAVAWDGSNASGGDPRRQADAVARHVSVAFHLNPACTAGARALAEAAIRARSAELRPTARLLKSREDDALRAWTAARCPDSAVVGIAFGVSEAARAARELRTARLREPS